MTFYVTNQNTVVFVLVLFGIFCGFVRDIITVKRRFIRTGAILSFFEDLIYCLIFTVLYHITVFVTNYGYVRWYEFASLFAGFSLYRFTISKAVITVLCALIGFITKIIRILLKPVMTLVKIIYKKATALLCVILRFCYKKRVVAYSKRMCRKHIRLAQGGFL
ncbi:MAG: spore cortex biosynthesis protein YabQ [Clostridia bacterium]|nr:spore cortex biosynthesis protein YabQ [Clostridia bacterium]